MWHYYIYYRVDAADTPTLEPLVRSMQARLECRTKVAGRLLKQRADSLLWMEIYENVTESALFESALDEVVAQFEIEMFLAAGSRRVMECFEDV